MKSRLFYFRSLIAFLMTTGFLTATITGVVLYVTPVGRIANWTGWTLWSLNKDEWGNVHIVTGLMFILAGLVHLYFNWKPLKHYLVSKAAKGFNRRWEALSAIAITAFLVIGSIQMLPPVNYVIELNDWAKNDLWADSVSSQRGTRGDRHTEALENATEAIDAALAKANQGSNSGNQRSPDHEGRGQGTGGGGGGGYGRMTLQDIAYRYGLDYQAVKAKLVAANVAFDEGETLRTIAVRAGMTPGELGALAGGPSH